MMYSTPTSSLHIQCMLFIAVYVGSIRMSGHVQPAIRAVAGRVFRASSPASHARLPSGGWRGPLASV